ncbi:putative signal transduction protein with Nacht domain [[Leptolyngbya] sp. PCC 7376]|uniref:NACHT domain-containing protein n=1 Tax=[Leptolyngbya] sp. PCC 7376 TaxID=111781 RepID=UPI00029F3F03|nr:NACHT domain-containing protein [[Leptolyngbya] sp. PCC 7376]AFY37634.1 putative signal transduction protein with Nacht domain [[Leptolyngbya] sp. PCC 7376]
MQESEIFSVIPKIVSGVSKPVFKSLQNQGLKKVGQLEVDFNFCFTEYLKRNFNKCSKTKTILYRDQPVNLKDFYVRTDLQRKGHFLGQTITENEFLDIIKSEQRIIISGTAGSGKSTFCKSIFLDLIETHNEIIPLFLELRQLNSEKELSILEYLINELKKFKSSFAGDQLDYALKKGKIILILDGFDEVNRDRKEVVEREIIEIAGHYENVLLVCSTRPDDRFISWEEFHTYQVLPLDKVKALNLIRKMRFDATIKSNFIKALDANLYDKHKSFASNPLLLTMMLLTYEQIAEIPEKIHLFYHEAFSTLFHKHDAFKSSYRRKTYTGLSIDDFAKLLSTFSLLSYSQEKYSFSRDELIELLKASKKISKIIAEEENILNDLLFSVCILQKDGLKYTFTHRSFQEYFTALFLTNFNSCQKYELFEKVAFTNRSDSVIMISLEINQELVEKEWIIPKLKWFLEQFSSKNASFENTLNNISLVFSGLQYFSASDMADMKNIDISEASPDIGLTYKSPSKIADCYMLFEDLYKQEMNSFCGEMTYSYSTQEKDAKQKLLSSIELNFHPLLFESISPEIQELIEEANLLRYYDSSIKFFRSLLTSLEEKHNQQEKDITEFILQDGGTFK